MLLLTSTSDKLQVVSSSTATTDVQASWVDYASGTITPGRTNSAISTATTTDVVAPPAASTQRNVKHLSVRNRHASTAQDVTVKHTDGTTIVELFKCTLAAGEELIFSDGHGFQVFDSTGAIKQTLTVGELNYVEITAGVAISATTEATANTIVTASAITFDGATPVYIEFSAPAMDAPVGSGDRLALWLYDGSSSIGQIHQLGVSTAPTRSGYFVARRLTPSAASHTYSIRGSVVTASGQIICGAGGNGNIMPAFLRIRRA